MKEESRALLERWRNQLGRRQSAQYLSAEHCRRINNWLGIPVIIATGIVGSTVFATLSKDFGDSVWLKIGLGFLSVISAVLASLQTFLKYSERAEKQLVANRQFGRLKQEVELLLAFPPDPGEERPKIAGLGARIDQAIEQSVLALERVWARVRTEDNAKVIGSESFVSQAKISNLKNASAAAQAGGAPLEEFITETAEEC